MEDGKVILEIEWNEGFSKKLKRNFESSQKFIDTECLRHCAPLIPKDSSILIQSGVLCTEIGSGELQYNTPYARRWYYMPANFQGGEGTGKNASGRGNYWFERMKRQYKEQILAGAKKLAGAK